METPNQNKIIWFLWGNPTFTASSRIHGFAIHKKLVALGYNSYLAYVPKWIEEQIPLPQSAYDSFSSCVRPDDLIVLQKIKNAGNVQALEYFKKNGLKVILIDCDLPIALEIARISDSVICTSEALREKYLEVGIIASFIEDAPELFFRKRPAINDSIRPVKSKKLKCYWFGEGVDQRWKDVILLKQIMSDPRLTNWELITVSDHPESTVRWQPDYLEIIKSDADIVAVPVFDKRDENQVKSANRVLQALALSLPVICSSIPSYEQVATSGKGLIICHSAEDWINAFISLEDANLRAKMSSEAYKTAEPFGMDHAIEKWLAELGVNEKYKVNDVALRRKVQRQLNKFLYKELIKKNFTYIAKAPFSLSYLPSALIYFGRKITSAFR